MLFKILYYLILLKMYLKILIVIFFYIIYNFNKLFNNCFIFNIINYIFFIILYFNKNV